jgi:hypothetical protein
MMLKVCPECKQDDWLTWEPFIYATKEEAFTYYRLRCDACDITLETISRAHHLGNLREYNGNSIQ